MPIWTLLNERGYELNYGNYASLLYSNGYNTIDNVKLGINKFPFFSFTLDQVKSIGDAYNHYPLYIVENHDEKHRSFYLHTSADDIIRPTPTTEEEALLLPANYDFLNEDYQNYRTRTFIYKKERDILYTPIISPKYSNNWDVIYDTTIEANYSFYYRYFINMRWLSEISNGKIYKLNHARWNLRAFEITDGTYPQQNFWYPEDRVDDGINKNTQNLYERERYNQGPEGFWHPVILKTFNLTTLDNNHPLKPLGVSSVVNPSWTGRDYFKTALVHLPYNIVFTLAEYYHYRGYQWILDDTEENHGFSEKSAAIQYLSEYMRQNDYHSCTFYYENRKPYLHFIARRYHLIYYTTDLVGDRTHTVDNGEYYSSYYETTHQRSTLYIKDDSFVPDVYNFEDDPEARSFEFQYNPITNKFGFWWEAKKTIFGYKEPIRVISFELYYFKNMYVVDMSSRSDYDTFLYTLEDLHSDWSNNPRVQAADQYLLEEPYICDWQENLLPNQISPIDTITGTWFIKARNSSGLGNPSRPLYIPDNIAISEYDWVLSMDNDLSLVWKHNEYLTTISGPIRYVFEFTNLEDERSTTVRKVNDPTIHSSAVSERRLRGGGWKELYVIPGEGSIRIQTYGYGSPGQTIDVGIPNSILALNVSISTILNPDRLSIFTSNPLTFGYDYIIRKYYFSFYDANTEDKNLATFDLQILEGSEWIGLGSLVVISSHTNVKQAYLPRVFNRPKDFQDGYWRIVAKLFADTEVSDSSSTTPIYKNGFVDPIVFVLETDNNKPRDFNFNFTLIFNEPILTLDFNIPYLPYENTYIPGPIEFRIYKLTGTTYTLFETFIKNDTAAVLNEKVSHTINLTDVSPDDIIGAYYVGTFWSLNETETLYYSSITNFNLNSTNILRKLFVSFEINKPEVPANFDIVFPQVAHDDIKLSWDLSPTILQKTSDVFYDIYIRTRNDSLSVQYIAKLYSIPLGQNEANIINNNKYEHTIDSDKIFNYNDTFSANSDIITIHVNTGYLCELLIKVTNVCVESEFSDSILLKQPTIPNNNRPTTQMVNERNGKRIKTNEYINVFDLNNFNGSFLYLKDLQLTLPTMNGDVEYSLLEENFRYVDPEVEDPIERITYHIIRKIDDSVILTSEDFTSTLTYVDGKYPYINLDNALHTLKTTLQTEGVSTGEIALEDILFILKLDLAYVVVIEGDVTVYLNAFDSLIHIQNLPITFTAEPQPVPKEYEEYEPLVQPLREKTLLDGIDFDITKAGHVFSKEVKTKNIKSSYSFEKNDNDKYVEPVLKIESKSAINLEIKDASEILEIGDKIIFTNGKGLQKTLNTIIYEKQIEIEMSTSYMYIQIIYSDKILFNIVELKFPPSLGHSIIDFKFDLYEHNDVRKDMFASDIFSVKYFQLKYPQDFNSGSFLRQISFDDYDDYDVEKRYTVSLSFEILKLGDYGNNSTIFVNNVRVVALENMPLVDSIFIEDFKIINTIYSQSIYVKFKPHQRILSGIDTTFSIGFYDINDSVFDKNSNIYQDLSLQSITEFFEFHYQLFNVFDKYNINNFNNSKYYLEKYTPNSTVKNHQFIQNGSEVLNFFVKNTLNMNTPVNIATHLENRIDYPPSPELSTKDFITLESDGLYYFNFKVRNTEYSYDDLTNGVFPDDNKIKLTSFLEFHLEKEVDTIWDADFIIYYNHTRNLPTETKENGAKYLEYSIPFGLDDLRDNLKDIITTFNPTSLLVGKWRLKIVNMYYRENTSTFEFEISPPQLPLITVITHIGLTKYKVEFENAIENSYTFESLHFDSINESDRKSIIIHRFDFSSDVPHQQISDEDGSDHDHGPEYPFLIKNALLVYTEIKKDNDNHFDLKNINLVGFPKYNTIEENLEPNNMHYYFKLIYLDEIEINAFSSPVLTPINWISKEDDIDLVIEYNTDDSARDTIEIYDVTTNQTQIIETFYYKHIIFFTINQETRTIYIDSEEYNLKIQNKNGYAGDGINFFVKDIVGVSMIINLNRNLLRRSYNSSVAKDRTFICPYEVRILNQPNYFTVKNIVYNLDCKYWIHAVVDDYEFKDNKTLEHFYINVADELYGERAPKLFTYPSRVIEYKVINDILVLQEMTGTKQTYFDFKLSYTFRTFRFIYRQKIPWLSAQEYWNINLSDNTNPHLFAQENNFFSPLGDPVNARNYAQHGMYQYVEGFTPGSRPKLRIWNGKVSTINFDWSPSSEQRGNNNFSYTYGRNTGDYDKTWTISEHFLPIIYKQNAYDETVITRRNVHKKINFKPILNFTNVGKPYKIKDEHPYSYVPAFIDKIDFENKTSKFYTQNLPIAQEFPNQYDVIKLGDTMSSSPMLVNGVSSFEYEVSNIKSGWWKQWGLARKPNGKEPMTRQEKMDATWTPTLYRVNHDTLKELLYHNKDFFDKIKYIIEIKPERSSTSPVQQENTNFEKYTFFRLERLSKNPYERRPYAHEKFYVPVEENTMATQFLGQRNNPNPTPIFSCEYLLYTTNDKLTTLLNNIHSFSSLDYFEEYETPYSQLLFKTYSHSSFPGYYQIYNDDFYQPIASYVVYTNFTNPLNYGESFRVILYEIEYPQTSTLHPISYYDDGQDLEQYLWYNSVIGIQSPFTPEMLWGEPNDKNIGVNDDETDLHQYNFDNAIFEVSREFYYYYDGAWNATFVLSFDSSYNRYTHFRDLELFPLRMEISRIKPNNPYNNIKWYHLNTTLIHTPSNISYTYNSNYPYEKTVPTYKDEGGPTRNANDDTYLYYPWYVDDNEIGNGNGNGTSGYEFNRDEIVIHLERKVFNGFHLDLYFDHEIWNHDRELENLRTSMLALGMNDGGKKLLLYVPENKLSEHEILNLFKNAFPELWPEVESINFNSTFYLHFSPYNNHLDKFLNLFLLPKSFWYSYYSYITPNRFEYDVALGYSYDGNRRDFKNDDPHIYYHWEYLRTTPFAHTSYLKEEQKSIWWEGKYMGDITQWRLYGRFKDKYYFSPFDIYSSIHLNFRYLISLRLDCEFLRYKDAIVWNTTLETLDSSRVSIYEENLRKLEEYWADQTKPYMDSIMYVNSNLEYSEPMMKIYEDHAESNIETRSTYAITEFQFGVYPGDPRHDVSYSNLLINPFKEYFNTNDETLLDSVDYIEEPLQAGPWPSTNNVLNLLIDDWDTKTDVQKETFVSDDIRFSRWRNLNNNGNFANPFVRHEFLRRINTKGYSTYENHQSIEILTNHLVYT